ncbi:secondary thiamine-phosphate synthase enzyme YjbQ [Natronoarchaeum sp. GCM10025703]|uniref:secondary thiamine-phosphate synthase enzyme YjbQ n=1 Tax=unclassified Natronoarchaeum TaxID=2620183 RepID=UPI0036186E2B
MTSRNQFSVSTGDRLTVVDVTDKVEQAIPDDVEQGLCTVFVQHTTAALVINEAEPRLLDDIEGFLSSLVPDEGHSHDELDENADSHLRTTLLGPSETIPVVEGTLDTGTWQSVLLVECDGPRTRTVSVTVVGA